MMFPTIDNPVIQTVVESHNHIQDEDEKLDACIGDLLQLTDPNFKVGREDHLRSSVVGVVSP